MGKMRLQKFAVILLVTLFFISGCGYTTKSLLPPNLKTIYVDNLVNKINLTAESNDDRMYLSYRPGMEIETSRVIRDKYLSDGNLKVIDSEDADLTLKGELVDFRNEALRYDRNDNVQEYRIRVVVNIEMINKDGKVRWKESGFAGESLYTTTGPLAKSERTAVLEAEADLARRVVERTIEEW
ncbi:MAG: LPS assembly lipoprotein LptE [Candidatus Omnitrophota bacterium]|nr:LPS assembly lipoprotein LptE [Candidatus Omnitrophota bacterium]